MVHGLEQLRHERQRTLWVHGRDDEDSIYLQRKAPEPNIALRAERACAASCHRKSTSVFCGKGHADSPASPGAVCGTCQDVAGHGADFCGMFFGWKLSGGALQNSFLSSVAAER